MIGNALPQTLPKLKEQTTPTINQRANKETSMYCTRVSAYKAIYHNTWRGGDLTNEYLVDKAQAEHNRGTYTIGRWDSTLNGVKNAIKDWNAEQPDDKVFFLVEPVWSDTFWDAIKKGYMVVFSYKGKNSYHSDINADGRIDHEEHAGSRLYGHTSNIIMPHAVNETHTRDNAKQDYKDKALVVDQFYQAWRDNSYILNINDLYDLVRNNTFYHNCYIILPESVLKKGYNIAKVSQMAKGKKIALVSQNAVSIAWNYTNSPKLKKEAEEYAKAVGDEFGNLRWWTEAEKAILTLKWALSFSWEYLDDEWKALAEKLSLHVNKTGIRIG